MLPSKIVFVDIETTGSRVNYDRIIEIGILRIENNQLTQTYKTLINPQTYISPFIESMTGITKDDLVNAPTFGEVKNEIQDLLADCYFVAHNVRFDYGFLRNEFKRYDISFSSRHFCTVRLSRTLYPQFTHHNLDSIIDRFGFSCEKRHRAFEDAKVLWDFYQKIQQDFEAKALEKALDTVLKRPSLPHNLNPDILDSLPESSGVYIFYGTQGTPLYVGKSVNIRDRVMSHFSNDHASTSEMNLCQQIESIETFTTAGELGALFKESLLVKSMQPLYNKKLRLSRKLIYLKNEKDQQGYNTISLHETDRIDPAEIEDILGVFKSKKQAKTFLVELVKKYSLCDKLLTIEKTKGACFSYRLGWCKGACTGKEPPSVYNLRFIIAFAEKKIKSWPFSNPVAIIEKNPHMAQEEWHIIDKWCYLGSIHNGSTTISREYIFDNDTYKIISSYIRRLKNTDSIKELSYKEIETLAKDDHYIPLL